MTQLIDHVQPVVMVRMAFAAFAIYNSFVILTPNTPKILLLINYLLPIDYTD